MLNVGLPLPCSMPCNVVLLIAAGLRQLASEIPAAVRSLCTLSPTTCAEFMRTSIVANRYQ